MNDRGTTRRSVLLAAVITAAAAFPYALFFTPTFQTNDDAEMSLLIQGQLLTDVPDARLMFSHVLIGRGLTALTKLAPNLNWYGLYLFAVHGASLLVLLSVALLSGRHRAKIAGLLVLLAGVEVYVLNNLQFTTVAWLAGVAGFAAIMRSVQCLERGWRVMFCVTGVLLLTLCSMIRWHVLPLSAVCLAPFLIGELLTLKETRQWRLPLTGLIAAGVLAVSLQWYQQRELQADPDWSRGYERQQLAATLIDYKLLPFNEANAGHYQAVGWSQADYDLLMWYVFHDEKLFATETLQRLLAVSSRRPNLNPGHLLQGTIAAGKHALSRPVVLACFLTAFALAVTACDRRSRRVVLVALLMSLPLTFLILEVKQRCPDWVQLPILCSPLLIALLCCRVPGEQNPAPINPPADRSAPVRSAPPGQWLLFGAVILSGWLTGQQRDENLAVVKSRAEALADLRRLADGKPQVLVSLTTLPLLSISPVHRHPELDRLQLCHLGTGQTMPWARQHEERIGLNDPLHDLTARPGTRLAVPAGYEQFAVIVARHLQQRLKTKVTFRRVFQGSSMQVMEARVVWPALTLDGLNASSRTASPTRSVTSD